MNQILRLANAIRHVSFVDGLVTSLAARFSLVDVTMWGIQFLSTIFERVLLFLSCAIVVAITMVVARRLHSREARLYVATVAVFVIFRGDSRPTRSGAAKGRAPIMISGLRRWGLAGLNASTPNVSPINGTSRTLKNSGVI